MDSKLEVFKHVELCFKKAEAFFEQSLPRPKISFDIKGQDAGRAYFPVRSSRYKNNAQFSSQSEIKFNEYLLEKNLQIFLEMIVPHECAHLIVYELFGTQIKPHGEQWQSVMEGLFNTNAKVRHDLDVSALVNKPFIYSCACQHEGVALAKRQHKNVQKGAKYLCRRCRSSLQYAYTQPEQLKKVDALEKQVACLYIYAQSSLATLLNNNAEQAELGRRLTSILNRHRPGKVYASSNLSEALFFKDWLRKEGMLRKFRGQYDINFALTREEFDFVNLNVVQIPEPTSLQELSHVIVIAEGLSISEKEYFSMLARKGVKLRQLLFNKTAHKKNPAADY